MPVLGELLERFRHAATPGPPVPAGGIPGDVSETLAAELRPLIAALDEVDREARALVDAAMAEAAGVRQRGARDAERILAEARRQEARLRERPRGERLEDDAEEREILARARAEADGVRRRARSRIPRLVARVGRCLGAAPEPDAARAAREEDGVAGVGRG